MSRPGTLDCCRDGDEADVETHAADCEWVARQVQGFRAGLWRHYKGGVYHAICLVTHHETRRPMVLYESYTYGGTNVRPLVGWPGDADGWLDEIDRVTVEGDLHTAEAILSIDCGATCGGNWRLPCHSCTDREVALREELRLTIEREEVRRHRVLGHDKRDGNKMRHKQGQYAGRST